MSNPINPLRTAQLSRGVQSTAEHNSTQYNTVEQRRADQTVAKKKKNLIQEKTEQTQKKCYTKNKQTNKLRGLSPRVNYTNRAAAAGRRS